MPRRRSHGLTFSATLCSSASPPSPGSRRSPSPVVRRRRPTTAARSRGRSSCPARRRWRCSPTCDSIASARRPSSSVRTATTVGALDAIAADGTVGAEQIGRAPAPGRSTSCYALAGVDAPGDRVIIGVLVPAANGSDAELRLIVAAPADGGPAARSGTAHRDLRRRRSATPPPRSRWGPRPAAMYAGVAWIDAAPAGRPTPSSTGRASWSATRPTIETPSRSGLRLPRLWPRQGRS